MTAARKEGTTATLAAFYLPQFHPIPENDEFWGPGFTEWRNVVRARPAFRGHVQPQIPADLGFYDLRCVETQQAQAVLAAEHGIGAFCYYHYWFSGHRVLDRPVNQMLGEPSIQLPFFLCWANENWTRRWDGEDDHVLLRQRYSYADDISHIRSLLPYFQDDRYFRIDGQPVFLVYRARLLPEPQRTADLWRREAERHGLGGLHLCSVESFGDERGDPASIGFDASVEFQPDWLSLVEPEGRTRWRRLGRRLGRYSPWLDHRIFAYADLSRRMADRPEPAWLRYGGVAPRWDNSARRSSQALILRGSTPELYGDWLQSVVDRAVRLGHPLAFVNAWNEWAEGAYLEPDLQTGRTYLEATARVMGVNLSTDRRGSDHRGSRPAREEADLV